MDEKINYLNELTSKYNWFSPEEKKSDIPDYIKISYVFCYGTIFEVFKIIKLFDLDLLEDSLMYVKDDWYALKEKRKDYINVLLNMKKNGSI